MFVVFNDQVFEFERKLKRKVGKNLADLAKALKGIVDVDKVALALRDYEDLINKFESNESVSDSLKGISLRSAQRTYGFYFSNLVQKVPNYRSEKVQNYI